MPILKSAIKRSRQTKIITARQRPYKTTMLIIIKNIIKYTESGDLEKAKKILPATYTSIDIAAKKNIIHTKNASNKKSRVARIINKLEKAKEAK